MFQFGGLEVCWGTKPTTAHPWRRDWV